MVHKVHNKQCQMTIIMLLLCIWSLQQLLDWHCVQRPLRRVEEDIGSEQLRTIRANFCGWLHVGTCHNIEWPALTNLEFRGKSIM